MTLTKMEFHVGPGQGVRVAPTTWSRPMTEPFSDFFSSLFFSRRAHTVEPTIQYYFQVNWLSVSRLVQFSVRFGIKEVMGRDLILKLLHLLVFSFSTLSSKLNPEECFLYLGVVFRLGQDFDCTK